MKQKKPQDVHPFVYDDFAWTLASRLLEDFKPFIPLSDHDAMFALISERNVVGLRAKTFECGAGDHQPYTLKLLYQLHSLFKKFQFQHDVYTKQTLQEDSIKKFMDNQERLIAFSYEPDEISDQVLFAARGYADQILGYFDPLEVMQEATFGKKSSVGIPMRLACEGERYEAPITGSPAHITWFDKIYSCFNRPAYLYAKAKSVHRKVPLFRVVDRVEATLVNKTWKSLRMICPNTTLGTLYTGGLGRVTEKRLRAFGNDIRTLQKVHGELARFGSLTGSLVTADQSLASDNITTWLTRRVLPRSWASAFELGRIGTILLYGRVIETPTFSTMGIGFTFPLQTLVFLCLLLAIRDVCGLDESHVVSVYGDDLIYDKGMHDVVMRVFPKLGLVINKDKTFAEGYFRESCGSDYYRGVNVRPFLLGRSDGPSASKRRAEAYLYKTFNGLLFRWEPYEIPSTLKYITEEIRRIRGSEPLTVPLDYPDASGCKVDEYQATLIGLVLQRQRSRHGTFHFRYLAFEPKWKEEDRHAPYLFKALSRESVTEVLAGVKPPSWFYHDLLVEKSEVFHTEEDPSGVTFRSKLTGRRLRRRLTFIPEQNAGRYREQPGVTSHWTPERTEDKITSS